MNHPRLQRLLPSSFRNYVLHFEACIERSVAEFSAELPTGAWVLDAGAGEAGHASYFHRQRYIAVDLGVGDASWNYGRLDTIGDLTALPFADACFDAAINVVTLEHIREPGAALQEIYRVLRPGGRLLLVAPHEWEVHQSPHDFFRYTRHGLAYLFEKAGFAESAVTAVGGYFRLLSRRLLNGLQFFRGLPFLIAALILGPPALLMPLLDSIDKKRDFTLGYICTARK